MKKVLIIAILMCVLCGCNRVVTTVEFEPVEKEDPGRPVPDLYFCPTEGTGQHKKVSFDVGEQSDMSFVMEWIDVSIPQKASSVSYFYNDGMLYYSYTYYIFIFDGTGNQEERLLNEEYSTKLMCYNVRENTTTEIATFPNGSDISNIFVSGDYLSLNLWTIREETLTQEFPAHDYCQKIFYIGENEMEEVELTNPAMTEQRYFSIADGKYALTSNNTVRDTFNKITKIDLEKDLAEYIMLNAEYKAKFYSKGYLICTESSGDIYRFDIYDLNGEYVVGFKSSSYFQNIVCNDKLCAWITEAMDTGGYLLYVYNYERDEVFVMDYEVNNSYLACDGDRVYFGGDFGEGINCYDSHQNTVCRGLVTGMDYEINTGEGNGIFGQVSDPLSSTINMDEEGNLVYSLYYIK